MLTLFCVVMGLLILLAALRLSLPRTVPFFVFYPEPLEPHESHPRYWGFTKAREVWIPTGDGTKLHAWFFPATGRSPGSTTSNVTPDTTGRTGRDTTDSPGHDTTGRPGRDTADRTTDSPGHGTADGPDRATRDGPARGTADSPARTTDRPGPDTTDRPERGTSDGATRGTGDGLARDSAGNATRRDADARTARGAAIYFHGNAGHVGDRGAVGELLSRLGLDVLLPDYRGFGASKGKPSEEGLYEDADHAYRWITERKGVDPARLFLLGNSLGSAVAAELALRRPVAGVVLLGAFTSTPDIARARIPWLPGWYLDWRHTRFDIVSKAARLTVPALVAAGAEDQTIPAGQSRQVFDALTGPRRWLEVPGAGHNDIFSHELLWQELQRFTRPQPD